MCVLATGYNFNIFIEHLPERGGSLKCPEDFSRVAFQGEAYNRTVHFSDAVFWYITREEVEALIGCPFEAIPVPEES